MSVAQGHVILLDADGTVIWARNYHPELDTELHAISHDPSTGLLHLAGTTRGTGGGTQRTRLLSVDPDGEVRWEYEGDVGTPSRINEVTSPPGGGFAAAGFHDFVDAVVPRRRARERRKVNLRAGLTPCMQRLSACAAAPRSSA